jgi:hypothetical protein
LIDTDRPKLLSVPTQAIKYGATFNVAYSGRVTRVSLVAPGSTTHSQEFSQHVVYLVIESRSEQYLTLRMPPNPTIMIQGYHMLFLLDGDVPSEALWVQLNN